MADPVSRLQLAQQEIDRVFGTGYAAGHPELGRGRDAVGGVRLRRACHRRRRPGRRRRAGRIQRMRRCRRTVPASCGRTGSCGHEFGHATWTGAGSGVAHSELLHAA
jgi:hypothetical protein